MSPKVLLAPLLVFLVLGLLACGDSDREAGGDSGLAQTDKPAARSAKVRMIEFFYAPDPVRVRVGGEVTWWNDDPVPHTATAEEGFFSTEEIEPGEVGSVTLGKTGTYSYVCELHPRMHGTVEVVGNS